MLVSVGFQSFLGWKERNDLEWEALYSDLSITENVLEKLLGLCCRLAAHPDRGQIFPTLLYGLTSGPATSTGSSGHWLGLGLPILAPVINNHQQAQSDADVNDDDYGYCSQVHLHTVLTHFRGREEGRREMIQKGKHQEVGEEEQMKTSLP